MRRRRHLHSHGLPPGNWRLTVFDQWNDQIVDGLSTPVAARGRQPPSTWEIFRSSNGSRDLNTRTFIDDNKDGVYQSNELGIPFSSVSIRYRDGELANNLLTDFGGVANFNETFPLFNWYTVETDPTRYKTTGIHTVYDAGGPADGTTCGTYLAQLRFFRHCQEFWRTLTIRSPCRATSRCRARCTATMRTAPVSSIV